MIEATLFSREATLLLASLSLYILVARVWGQVICY